MRIFVLALEDTCQRRRGETDGLMQNRQYGAHRKRPIADEGVNLLGKGPEPPHIHIERHRHRELRMPVRFGSARVKDTRETLLPRRAGFSAEQGGRHRAPVKKLLSFSINVHDGTPNDRKLPKRLIRKRPTNRTQASGCMKPIMRASVIRPEVKDPYPPTRSMPRETGLRCYRL